MKPPMRKLRIAVLMGGSSSERPVSLSTGRQIVEALDREKYQVTAIDTQDLLGLNATYSALPASASASGKNRLTSASKASAAALTTSDRMELAGMGSDQIESDLCRRPDVVFIALHGKGGEDGTVQGLLEFMGLAYTGSGVLASALAMDKTMAKRLFLASGIPVIEAVVASQPQADTPEAFAEITARIDASVGYPVFVKPNAEGSTFGCTLVESRDGLRAAVWNALKYDSKALIERYIRGIEITVGVLETEAGVPEALPVIEIVPKSAYYDYESKYAPGGSEHIIPARISKSLQERAQSIAVRCHTLLGCRGMSRTDLIVSEAELYVLEVNTIPGMTPTSLLPQAAAHAGITFPELLDRLIRAALSNRSAP